MELDQQILTCYQHVTPISIAKMLDISYNKVYHTLLKYDINIEPINEYKKKCKSVEETEAMVRACVGYLTWKSIAKVTGISYDVVYKIITKKFNIKYEKSSRENPNYISQVKPKVQHVRRFKYKNNQLY